MDYTLCDFCAGTRAGTPSIAGEIVNSRASRIVSDIFEAMDALNAQVKKRYASECVRLVGLGGAVTKSVSVKVAAARASVGIAADKGLNALRNQHSLRVNGTALVSGTLSAAADRRLREKRAATDALSAMLAALDPHRIFKAGYAAVVKGGRRVSEAAALATGESVQMIFPDGVATATVTDIKRYK